MRVQNTIKRRKYVRHGTSWFPNALFVLLGPRLGESDRKNTTPLSQTLPAAKIREEKQHKHKLFGPDFPRTFLTLTPECPGVKKFLPTTGAAGKTHILARTSMTRRVVEKLCKKKFALIFWPLINCFGSNFRGVKKFQNMRSSDYWKIFLGNYIRPDFPRFSGNQW